MAENEDQLKTVIFSQKDWERAIHFPGFSWIWLFSKPSF